MAKDNDRAKQVLQELKSALAKAITEVYVKNDIFRHLCERSNWDETVCFEVDDGLKELGVALATLERWYEDEDEGENNGN